MKKKLALRVLWTLTLTALAVVSAPASAQPADGDGEPPKVVVLGFDGADSDHAARWMDEGKLPNLARLRDQGTFRPLRPTIPSQTPVSWSTFATGLSPGRHGIFDFLKRDPETYRPGFAAADEIREPLLWGTQNALFLALLTLLLVALIFFGLLKLFRLRTPMAAIVGLVLGVAAAGFVFWAAGKWVPVDRPVAVNNQQGETFWEILGRQGHRVKVVRVPVTFPPEPFDQGELLTGLGTPDLSFRIGKPFYFTSELFFTPPGGGDFSIEVVELIDNQGDIPTEIKGPPNKLFPDEGGYITIPMDMTVAEDKSRLDLRVSGQELSLAPGEWSDWVRFTFPFNPLVKLHGIGRFRLLSLEPEVRLYLSPIQFDPEKLPPIVDITYPAGFVDELTEHVGLFKTIGWSIDTWSIDEGTIDEDIFMEDVHQTVDKYKEMLFDLLGQDDWDMLVHYFEFTDRVQHVMYRHFDTESPLYTPEGGAKYGNLILEAYQEMDSIVGETLERMPEGSILFVVSDHGFAPFRRSMNYNTWLAKNGFMKLTGEDDSRKNLEDLFDQGDFFVNVDWSQTQAYALGLGQIYINLAGREAQGSVQPGEEYERVAMAIKEGLEAYVDEETGKKPVAHVFTRDEAYGVYDERLIPDLIPSNSEGYRVGWQDSLGGIAKTVVEDNTKVWSGDHCSVYPPLVEGILFSNRVLDVSEAHMADVMPTLLAIFGAQAEAELDGRSLWPRGGARPGTAPSRPGSTPSPAPAPDTASGG